MKKSIVSMILVFSLLFTMFPLSAYSLADESTQNETSEATLESDELAFESDNALGNMLSSAMEEKQDEEISDDNYITEVELNDDVADVSLVVEDDSIVRVDICDENSNKVITSGVASVDGGSENATVKIDTQNVTLPKYYLTKAVILDEKSNELSGEYVDESNTQWYEDFSESEVSDYDADRVINLDESKDNNFAVLNDEVKIIDSTSSKNTLTQSNGEYIFTNADADTKQLSSGDIFCYNADDPDNIVLGEVTDVTTSGSTVTVRTKEPALDETFDMIKINYAQEKCLMEDPDAVPQPVSSAQSKKSPEPVGGSVTAGLSASITKKFAYGSASFTTDIEVKCEYSVWKKYVAVSAKVTPSANVHVEISKKISKIFSLGSVKIPTPVAGLAVKIELKAQIEASAKLTSDFKMDVVAGYKWSNTNGKQNLSRKPHVSSEIHVEGQFYIGLIIKPTINALAIADFGFSCSVGGEISASSTFYRDNYSQSKHDCIVCIDGNFKIKLSVNAEISIDLVFYKYEKSFKIYSTEFLNTNFYYSATFREFGFGDCAHYSYKANFTVLDSSGKPISGAKIDGLTTSKSGKASKFYTIGGHSVRVSKSGYKSKVLNFGITNNPVNKTIVLSKGSSSSVETETDSSYASGLSYKKTNGSGSGYSGGGKYGYTYLAPLQYKEPGEGVVLSVANAYQRRFDVAWVQRELKKLGYSCPVDGYYGNSTAAAVRRFQTDYSLAATGVCNLATISMIKYPYKPVTAPVINLTTPQNIPSGGIATVKWDSVAGASEYDVYLYKTDGTLVNSLTKVKGNTASFVCYEAGTYVVKAVSENFRYTSSTASSKVITVHNPLTVTFVDADDTVLSKQLVEYGGAATAPTTPETYGYVFSKWDKSFNNVTTDNLTVKAVYTKNIFKVTFTDINGNVIETQKVPYLESATAPTTFEVPTGYKFVGWDKDYTKIEGDTKIKTVLQWENEELPIIIESCTAVRESECTGYTVTAVLRNYDKQRTNGRVVVALKTTNGKFLTMTESSAFTLAASNSAEGTLSKKTIEVFVPYEGVATKAEVYVVETYGDLIPISEKACVDTDRSEDWTAWITEDKKPDSYYQVSEPRTEYRYKTKSTTTSTSSSYAGWIQDGSFITYGAWTNVGWTKTQPTTSSTLQITSTRTVTDVAAYTKYHYYYYRYWNTNAGTYYYTYSSSMGGTRYDITRTSPLTYKATYSGHKAYVSSPAIYFSGELWFENGTTYVPAVTHPEWYYQTRTATTNYNYYKWSDWSEWSTTPVSASDSIQVETRTTNRYLTEDPTEDESGIERTISGQLDTSYANKQLSLFIYKVDDASDYTNEYVGQTTVGEDGSYSFTFKLREEPTSKTGDFTVAIGIEGTNSLMHLDSIEAEKPKYTVNICDYDGTIIETQLVSEGESAVIPDEIPQRNGYTFAGWDCSNRGIYEDMNITAMYVPKTYTVVYIDWTNELYELKTYRYGEKLEVPEIADTENAIAVGWDAVISGIDTVTKNMVVTAKYETKKYSVTFYDYEGNILETQTIEYGGSATVPNMESNSDYEFLGWDESVSLDNITENIKVYPDFKFTKTTAQPVASVESGVYSDTLNVTLSCETENSIIYYSIDGGEEFEYTGSLTISKTSVIEFYASALGYNNSEMQNVLYVINRAGDEANHTYPVEIRNADGNVIGKYIVADGDMLSYDLLTLTKDGYTLEGLYKDSQFTEKWDMSNDKVNGLTVLYANWTVNKYTVTFVYEDGTVIDTQTVEYMNSALEPEEITVADGYALAGWSTEDYICVTEDITVTAVIKKESEVISLNISKNNYSMIEGLSYSLSAVVTGLSNPDIVWISDDESVIYVDQNGNITALSEGDAIVTAYLVGTDYYAQCFVTVEPSPLNSICLNANSSYTLTGGMIFGVRAGENTVAEIISQLMNMEVTVTDKNGVELEQNAIAGTGSKVAIYDDYAELDSAYVIISGDINGDGYINNKDVAMLSRYLVDKEELSEYAIAACDVNADGVVNNRDAALLSRYLVGKENI